MDSVCRYFAMQKKASRKYCKIKSHQSGPGNGRFGFSTSDTRQSDIVSFVCFYQAVAWSFHNTWWIWKKNPILCSCFNKTGQVFSKRIKFTSENLKNIRLEDGCLAEGHLYIYIYIYMVLWVAADPVNFRNQQGSS